ncbi:ABC transporter ATP-binding protein [Proteiniborus sp. MB09-C3]|uniref:ABC transporter ATP-binding protein n=1 Tax=Proteiniborus sp. MB09-C3 TaxID=3050072 RepID=UPI00255496C2|nr:ABC transporter ATP-binding protein [Proteiniborus sp. MB09-C3]WIV13322.1 ABC transporter ATP-binding protein [Proteiniborus sp. MB09-C3]
MTVMEINALTRDYGNNRGIFDLSFTVKESEVFGFLGPNGAGKTTTIRHLMGFLKPMQGSCSILGKDCWKESKAVQLHLGYIPGEMSFPDDMTGIGFLEFYARYRGMNDNGRMNELLERFELDAKGKLKKMSKGMKQKVGIVTAFMHDPTVLILDEPTSGLDPLMQNRFIDLILEEKQRGKTILMSSHMFEEVERTCERVGIIRSGQMVAIDSVESLKAAQVKKYIITLKTEEAAKSFAKENLQILSMDGARVTVLVQNNIEKMITAMNRWPVTNIEAPNQSLEDIFLHYYGGEKE